MTIPRRERLLCFTIITPLFWSETKPSSVATPEDWICLQGHCTRINRYLNPPKPIFPSTFFVKFNTCFVSLNIYRHLVIALQLDTHYILMQFIRNRLMHLFSHSVNLGQREIPQFHFVFYVYPHPMSYEVPRCNY